MNNQDWKALDELIVINIYFKNYFWLAWSKIVGKHKTYFGSLMKLNVAAYDMWQICKYTVLLYLGNVYKKMRNKFSVEMFTNTWNSGRTNLKMQEIKPRVFGNLSATVDSYGFVKVSEEKITRWIMNNRHGTNIKHTWWPVQIISNVEIADQKSLPGKNSKNENCEKIPLPIRKSKRLLERKEGK